MPAIGNTERIYLRLERPGFPIDIAGIYLLAPSPDGPLPFEQVRAVFNQRRHQSPLWNRMVAHAPLGIGEDRWTQAAALDIDEHVRQATVPEPGDLPALLATVLEVSKDPLDRSRPLWEAWYITGMADGSAAVLLRTHHAIIDGMGIIKLQRVLFDTEPTPVDLDQDPPPVLGRRHPSLLHRALIEVPYRVATEVVTTTRIVKQVSASVPEAMVHKPIRVARETAPKLGALLRLRLPDTIHLPELPGYIPSPTGHPPVTLFNRHVHDPQKSIAVISLPLNDVRQVRRAFPHVTVNDILMTLVAGTLREYLAAHGDLPGEPIRATCPVNIRPTSEKAGQGNHITTMWIDLPVHQADPAERLAAVSASSTAAKDSLRVSQASWETLADVGDLLLPGVVAAAMAFAGTRVFSLLPPTQNLTVSTMIGPGEPLYLATRQITNMFTRTIICPPIHLFFSAITYNGMIDFTITTVDELCPDPDVLADGLRVELDRLLAVVH